jgi:hypothetical protein
MGKTAVTRYHEPMRLSAVLCLACLGCTKADVEPALIVPCASDTPAAFASCVDPARYQANLEAIAGPNRMTGESHWQEAQDRCASELAQAGYEVRLHQYGRGVDGLGTGMGVNVIGQKIGEIEPERFIVVSAHYDGIRTDCSAADDNASGVAGALEVGWALAPGRFSKSLLVVCWDEHEPVPMVRPAFVGSTAWSSEALAGGMIIDMVFVFEMIGYRSRAPFSQGVPPGLDTVFRPQFNELLANELRGDFILIAFNEYAANPISVLELHMRAAGVPPMTLRVPQDQLTPLAALARSDHRPFWHAGVPAAMLTDTGDFRNPNYHCPEDRGDDAIGRLDVDFASRVVRGTAGAVADALGPIPP